MMRNAILDFIKKHAVFLFDLLFDFFLFYFILFFILFFFIFFYNTCRRLKKPILLTWLWLTEYNYRCQKNCSANQWEYSNSIISCYGNGALVTIFCNTVICFVSKHCQMLYWN